MSELTLVKYCVLMLESSILSGQLSGGSDSTDIALERLDQRPLRAWYDTHFTKN